MVMISSFQVGFAQISLGIPAVQDDVQVTITESGDVHVVHHIQKNTRAQQVNLIDGTVSNLKVVNSEGGDVEFAKIGVEDIEGVSIFPTNRNVIVEYDLSDVLSLREGVWTWEFFYPVSTVFVFPESVDLVFANDRPVNIGYNDAKGMRCHGCQVILEYITDEPVNYQEIKWEDKTFTVEIRTLAEVSSFNFNQPTKTISFDINEKDRFVTLLIPLELLWNPYEVYVGTEKILKHEYLVDESHVQLNVRPETSGTIRIIGTTVVPEFPIFIPLMFGIIMVIALQFRNKLNLR